MKTKQTYLDGAIRLVGLGIFAAILSGVASCSEDEEPTEPTEPTPNSSPTSSVQGLSVSIGLFSNTGLDDDDEFTTNPNVNVAATEGSEVRLVVMTNLGTDNPTAFEVTNLGFGGDSDTFQIASGGSNTNIPIELDPATFADADQMTVTITAEAVLGGQTNTDNIEFKLVKGNLDNVPSLSVLAPIGNPRTDDRVSWTSYQKPTGAQTFIVVTTNNESRELEIDSRTGPQNTLNLAITTNAGIVTTNIIAPEDREVVNDPFLVTATYKVVLNGHVNFGEAISFTYWNPNVGVSLAEDSGINNWDDYTTNPDVNVIAPPGSTVVLTAAVQLNQERPNEEAEQVFVIDTLGDMPGDMTNTFTSDEDGTNEDLDIAIDPTDVMFIPTEADVLTVSITAVATVVDGSETNRQTNSKTFKLVKPLDPSLMSLTLHDTTATGMPPETPDARVAYTYSVPVVEGIVAEVLVVTNTETNRRSLGESPVELFEGLYNDSPIEVRTRMQIVLFGHEATGDELVFNLLRPNLVAISLREDTGTLTDADTDGRTTNPNINIEAPPMSTVTVTATTNLGDEEPEEHIIDTLPGGDNEYRAHFTGTNTNLDIGLDPSTDIPNYDDLMTVVVTVVADDDGVRYTNTFSYMLVRPLNASTITLEPNTAPQGVPPFTSDPRVTTSYTLPTGATAKVVVITNAETNEFDLPATSPFDLFPAFETEDPLIVIASIVVSLYGHETEGELLSFRYHNPPALRLFLSENTGTDAMDEFTTNDNLDIVAPAGSTVAIVVMTNLNDLGAASHALANASFTGDDSGRNNNIDLEISLPAGDTDVLTVTVNATATEAAAADGTAGSTFTDELEFKLVKGTVDTSGMGLTLVTAESGPLGSESTPDNRVAFTYTPPNEATAEVGVNFGVLPRYYLPLGTSPVRLFDLLEQDTVIPVSARIRVTLYGHQTEGTAEGISFDYLNPSPVSLSLVEDSGTNIGTIMDADTDGYTTNPSVDIVAPGGEVVTVTARTNTNAEIDEAGTADFVVATLGDSMDGNTFTSADDLTNTNLNIGLDPTTLADGDFLAVEVKASVTIGDNEFTNTTNYKLVKGAVDNSGMGLALQGSPTGNPPLVDDSFVVYTYVPPAQAPSDQLIATIEFVTNNITNEVALTASPVRLFRRDAVDALSPRSYSGVRMKIILYGHVTLGQAMPNFRYAFANPTSAALFMDTGDNSIPAPPTYTSNAHINIVGPAGSTVRVGLTTNLLGVDGLAQTHHIATLDDLNGNANDGSNEFIMPEAGFRNDIDLGININNGVLQAVTTSNTAGIGNPPNYMQVTNQVTLEDTNRLVLSLSIWVSDPGGAVVGGPGAFYTRSLNFILVKGTVIIPSDFLTLATAETEGTPGNQYTTNDIVNFHLTSLGLGSEASLQLRLQHGTTDTMLSVTGNLRDLGLDLDSRTEITVTPIITLYGHRTSGTPLIFHYQNAP